MEGVAEIIEIFQDEMLVHAWRRLGDIWVFESNNGADASIALSSAGIAIPLAVLYERVVPDADQIGAQPSV